MGLGFKKGSDNVIREVFIVDATTGLAKTGLAWDDAGAIASYNLPGGARVAIILATQTVTGVHSDGGFVEIDATNKKGHYRFDPPNAAFTGADYNNWQLSFTGAHVRPVADALPTNTPTDTYLEVVHAARGLSVLAGALISSQGAVADLAPAPGDFDTNLTQPDGFWNDQAFMFVDGAQKGKMVGVKADGGYVNSGGHIILDPALTVAPADGDNFVMLPVKFSAMFGRVLAESYRGLNATGSVDQILYEILALLTEFTITSGVLQTRKVDGSTSAKSYTHNTPSNPTGITQTS